MTKFCVMINVTFITVVAETETEAKDKALQAYKNSLMAEDLIAWEEGTEKSNES